MRLLQLTNSEKPEAANAYNKAARKHFGEFACLNEIPSGLIVG